MSISQLAVTSSTHTGSHIKRTPKFITARRNIFHIFGHESPFWYPINRPLIFEMGNHSLKVTLQYVTVMKITGVSLTPHSLHHKPGD